MPDLAELQVVVKERGVKELDAQFAKLGTTTKRVEASVKLLEKSLNQELNASLARSRQGVTDYAAKLDTLKSKVLAITAAVLRATQAFEANNRRLAEAQRWFGTTMSLKGPGVGIGAAFSSLSPGMDRSIQQAMRFGRELAVLQTHMTKMAGSAQVFATKQANLNAAFNGAVDPTNRLAAGLNKLGGAYAHLQAQTKTTGIKELPKELNNAARASEHLHTKTTNLRRIFWDLRTVIYTLGLAKIAHEFGQFAFNIVQVGMEMERLQISMKGLMGSDTGGAMAMDWMRTFAIETPYNIEQSMRAFMLLKAYGLDPMNGALQTAADLAARFGGDAEKFHFIALAMGQMSAHQRILSREMLQFAERGVPAWTWLTEAVQRLNPGVKITTSTMRELVAESKLGAKAVQALFDIMAEKSAGASALLMETLWGKLQKIGDMLRFMAMDLTQGGLFGGLKEIVDAVADSLNTLTSSGATARWGETIGAAFRTFQLEGAGLTGMLMALGDAVMDMTATLIRFGASASPLAIKGLTAMAEAVGFLANGYDVLARYLEMNIVLLERLAVLSNGPGWARSDLFQFATLGTAGGQMGLLGVALDQSTDDRIAQEQAGRDAEIRRLGAFAAYAKELGVTLRGDVGEAYNYVAQNIRKLEEEQNLLAVAFRASQVYMQGTIPDLAAVKEQTFMAAQASSDYAELQKILAEELGKVDEKLGPVGNKFQDVLLPSLRDAGQAVNEFLRNMKEIPDRGLLESLLPGGMASLDLFYQAGLRIEELQTKLQEMIRIKAPDTAFAALQKEVEDFIKVLEYLNTVNAIMGAPTFQDALDQYKEGLKELSSEAKKAAKNTLDLEKGTLALVVAFEDVTPGYEDLVEFMDALDSKTKDGVLTWREFAQALRSATDTRQGVAELRAELERMIADLELMAQARPGSPASLMAGSTVEYLKKLRPGLDRAAAELAQASSDKFSQEMNEGIANVFGDSFKALLEGRFEDLGDFLSDLFAGLAGSVIDKFVKDLIEGFAGDKGGKGGIGEAFDNYTEWIRENRGMATLSGAAMVYQGQQQGGAGGVLAGALGGAQAGAALFVAHPLIGAVIGAVVGAAVAYFGQANEESPETRISVRPGGYTSLDTRGGQGYSADMQRQAELEIQGSYRAIFRAYLEVVRAFRMGDLIDLLPETLPTWQTGTGTAAGWGEGGVESFQSWLQEVEFPEMFTDYIGEALQEGLERLGMSFSATSALFRELADMLGEDRVAALLEFVTTLRTLTDSIEELSRPISEIVGAGIMDQYAYQMGRMGESLSSLFIGWDEMSITEQAQMAGEINNLVMQARQAEIQMLEQLYQMQEQLNAGFDSLRESLLVGGMDPGEQVAYYMGEIESAFAILNDPTASPEQVARAAANIQRYIQALTQVLGGLGIGLDTFFGDLNGILAPIDEVAAEVYDLTGVFIELTRAMAELNAPIMVGLTAIQEYALELNDLSLAIAEAFEGFDWQDLEGSAESAREIIRLVGDARAAEIRMLEQIDSLQRSITASLQGQIEEYRIAQMSDQEQVDYYYQQVYGAQNRLRRATTPEEVQAATQDLERYSGLLYQMLQGRGFDANSILGDIFRRDGTFNPNQTLGDWLIGMLEEGQTLSDAAFERIGQDVRDRFQPFYDSLELATTALEDLANATDRFNRAPGEKPPDKPLDKPGPGDTNWWDFLFGDNPPDQTIGEWLTGVLDAAAAATTTAFDAFELAVQAQFQPFWDALIIATYWLTSFGEAARGAGEYYNANPTEDDMGGNTPYVPGARRGGQLIGRIGWGGAYYDPLDGKAMLDIASQQVKNVDRLVVALQGVIVQPVVQVTVIGSGVRGVSAKAGPTYLTNGAIS